MFEKIDVNSKSAKLNAKVNNLKRFIKRAVMWLAGLVILLVVVGYLWHNLDVYLFATVSPDEVRKAIIVNQQGEKVKANFIDTVYSNSIK